MKNKILEYSQLFFNKLGVNINSLEISEEDNLFYYIKLTSDDGALLIGQNGQTIESIQRILSLNILNKIDEKIKIKLEINNYYKSYEEKLYSRTENAIKYLEKKGGEYNLGKLSPYDRKRIHNYIAQNHKNIISKSKGEGKNRELFLFKKDNFKSKISIDIDGEGI